MNMPIRYTRLLLFITASVVLDGLSASAIAQEADVKPDSEIVAEQYLLIGNATRGGGESQVAINPLNPNQIAVAAMSVIHQNEGKFQYNELEFQRTPRATITEFAVSRDRGLTWTIVEDPMRKFYRRYRCLDPFAAFTPDGTLIFGCEAHFPVTLNGEQQIEALRDTPLPGRRVYGGSAMIWSTDGGHTFSDPVEVISTNMPKEVYGPFVSFATTGTTGDAPKIRVDSSNGKIYIHGNSTAADPPHSQAVVRMSKDRGRNWGMVYAFDSAEWPGSNATFDASFGTIAAVYAATQVPVASNAKCPCVVFEASQDDGKTFERRLIPLTTTVSPTGGGQAYTLVADQTKAGRFAVLQQTGTQVAVYLTEDLGKIWSAPKLLGAVPGTSVANIAAAYNGEGELGVSWRVVYPDPTDAPAPPRQSVGGIHVFPNNGQSFEIWSALARDGGKTFSKPLKVSTARSPEASRRRGASNHSSDYISTALDNDFVHLSWFDSRAGFLGTWYGRVPIKDYK